MEIKIDLDILEKSICLEPVVGEELLPRYPDALSAEEKTWFEAHLKACRLCQERLKLWRVTGLAMEIEAFLQRARTLLENRRYDEAIQAYNSAIDLDPNVLTTAEAQDFFKADAWFALTIARTKEQDLSSYVAPEYAPERLEMAAAKTPAPFPLAVEFADGKVKGKLTSAGQAVFFELLETSQEFEDRIMLVGKLLQPVVLLKTWDIVRGKKHRLGTIAALFGSTEFPDIINALKVFRVFPV